MADFERDVAELQQEAQAAAQAAQRAEAQAEAADAEYGRALARLRDEFGVESVEAGEALLARLDQELSSEIFRVRGLLAEARKVEESS